MKLELKNSLSVKLLRVVLLSALLVGVVLSCAQIVFDAYKTRHAVETDAERILGMFRDPSTQAVYSLDREMGMQVIEGLFQDDAVRMASIGHPNETLLAEKDRPLKASSSRWLTDLILGQERSFTTQLVGRSPYSEYYGDLRITLDTANYGEGFLVNAGIIFIAGVLRALAMGLVLYLVYHWLLTKPLSKSSNTLLRSIQTAPANTSCRCSRAMKKTNWASGSIPPISCWPLSNATRTCVTKPKIIYSAWRSTTF